MLSGIDHRSPAGIGKDAELVRWARDGHPHRRQPVEVSDVPLKRGSRVLGTRPSDVRGRQPVDGILGATLRALGGWVPRKPRMARLRWRVVRASRVVVGGRCASPCSNATGSGGWEGTTRTVANNSTKLSTTSSRNRMTASVNRFRRRPDGS